MRSIIRTALTIYGTACIVSIPYVLPKSYTNIWDDVYNSINKSELDKKEILCANIVSTSITLSVVPSICIFSPIIMSCMLSHKHHM